MKGTERWIVDGAVNQKCKFAEAVESFAALQLSGSTGSQQQQQSMVIGVWLPSIVSVGLGEGWFGIHQTTVLKESFKCFGKCLRRWLIVCFIVVVFCTLILGAGRTAEIVNMPLSFHRHQNLNWVAVNLCWISPWEPSISGHGQTPTNSFHCKFPFGKDWNFDSKQIKTSFLEFRFWHV